METTAKTITETTKILSKIITNILEKTTTTTLEQLQSSYQNPLGQQQRFIIRRHQLKQPRQYNKKRVRHQHRISFDNKKTLEAINIQVTDTIPKYPDTTTTIT